MKLFYHRGVSGVTLECACDVDMSEIESYADYVRNREKELIKKSVYIFLDGFVEAPQPRSIMITQCMQGSVWL